MESNAELLRRARLMRQMQKRKGHVRTEPTADEQRPPAHISHHAGYTALMRSHDRVRSRHTGGQS